MTSQGEDGQQRYGQMVEELITRYVAYFDHIAWPSIDTEEWEDMIRAWTSAFGEYRYSKAKIGKAMDAIKRKPPQWKTEHLPELLRLIEEDSESHAQRPAAPQDDPDAPACPHCGGGGFARAYRSDYDGVDSERVPTEAGSRIVFYAITGPCICPKGRRIWANWRENEIKSQDLAALPRGWSIEGSGHERSLASQSSSTPY